jgi:hypothetical protein
MLFAWMNLELNSPRIGQNIADTKAQIKLRFGCVSSSISDVCCCSIYSIKKTMNF